MSIEDKVCSLKSEACVLSKDDMLNLIALLGTIQDHYPQLKADVYVAIIKKLQDALNLG